MLSAAASQVYAAKFTPMHIPPQFCSYSRI